MSLTNSEIYHNLFRASQHLTLQTSRISADGVNKWGESDTHILVNSDDNGYLLHLNKEDITYMNFFYGNPTCGLLSYDSQWAIMADSNQITVWNKDSVTKIAFIGAFDLRQISDKSIYILVDPWFENSAIWKFNVDTHEFIFVCPFTDFKDSDFNDRYTETVIW